MAKRPIIVAMDLEGVLVPEVWISFAEKTGIPELRLTTRDISDYDALMKHRLEILKQNNLKLRDIQAVIDTMDPLPGAVEYMAWLRERYQGVILSDTFYEFASPLMRKLGWPTLFCNELVVAPNGEVTDFRLRCKETKLSTVRAFQSVGYETIASGDSFNDLAMIQASKAGFLFRAPDSIKAQYPDIPACEEYDDLLRLIKSAMV